MRAVVAIEIDCDGCDLSADQIKRTVCEALDVAPLCVGAVNVSVEHEGEPWPPEDSVQFEVGQSMIPVYIDGEPCLVPTDAIKPVEYPHAGTVTVVHVDRDAGVIRCSCPTCGGERC